MCYRGALVWCISLLLIHGGFSQWNPPDSLRDVPVKNDCKKTKGRIGMAFQPSLFNPHGIIFLCPGRAADIESRHPGASFFFRVHEYGHIALATRDEAAADAWAAEQLSQSENGRAVLVAVLGHFVEVGERFSPYYGTGFYRGLNVATTAGIDRNAWPPALLSYQQKWQERCKRNGSIGFQSERRSFFDGLVIVDGHALGFFDTRYSDRLLPLPVLDAGTHQLTLVDVWMYLTGSNNRPQVAARGMSATTSLKITKAENRTGYISEDDSELLVRLNP